MDSDKMTKTTDYVLERKLKLKGNTPTIPINDFRGYELGSYSKLERELRCQLASLFRLLDIFGWTQSIYNHISVRISNENFLINPFGLLYHEVQASSLVKTDFRGNVIDPGSTLLGINKAGSVLHACMHSLRSDINCVIHVHLPDVIAVSCLKIGLLPISSDACELIDKAGVEFHEYSGIQLEEKAGSSFKSDLSSGAKILFLRNHGVVILASSIPEAWYLLKRIIHSCKIQMQLFHQGGIRSSHMLKTSYTTRRPFDRSVGQSDAESNCMSIEKEFEAQMRNLDCAGFCTGHEYKEPLLLRRGYSSSMYNTMEDNSLLVKSFV